MEARWVRRINVVGLTLAVSSLAACGGGGDAREAPQPAPTAATAVLAKGVPDLSHGIDVSSHSGQVDWSKVEAAGLTFAFVKVSEGVDLPDPEHDRHWQSLSATDLTRGGYHFFVTEDDPEAQAKLFIEHAKLEPGDLAPVVDIELIGRDTPPGVADRLRRFLEILEQHYGVRPIIYTAPNFWDANMPADFGEYPLWIAEYGVDTPRLPNGWDAYHLWQYVDDHQFDGVEKDADLSRGAASADLWASLVIPAPTGG